MAEGDEAGWVGNESPEHAARSRTNEPRAKPGSTGRVGMRDMVEYLGKE
jgi:hypothetical protein